MARLFEFWETSQDKDSPQYVVQAFNVEQAMKQIKEAMGHEITRGAYRIKFFDILDRTFCSHD